MELTHILFVTALARLVAAHPHRRIKQELNERRQVQYVTEVQIVTAYAPLEVVYVDENGVPYSTSYAMPGTPTPAPAVFNPSPAVMTGSDVGMISTSPWCSREMAPAQATLPSSPPVAATLARSANAVPIPSSFANTLNISSGYGITYSPYNSDGSCKSQSQVSADFRQIAGYGTVRIYGTDCNQVSTVGQAALANGMKLFAGVFDLNSLSAEIATMAEAALATGGWDHFDTISIGNELVNSGRASAQQVTMALAAARLLLAQAGYTGRVVTVDTFDALIANPSLCLASDYAAANAHAFFDGQVAASDAGTWAANIKTQVQRACGGKETIITESGWPSCGQANGVAVPNAANQIAATTSLKTAFASGGLVLFSSFNDMWKQNFAGSFGAEQCWGILGMSSQ